MTDIATITVYSGIKTVGRIAVAEDGALSFGYSEEWLADTRRFPLSASIPLGRTEYTGPVIEPWLSNLIPEEQQLAGLTRLLGLDRTDIMGVLLAIGGDTAGALSFGEPSDPAHWAYSPLTEFYGEQDADAALCRHLEDLKERPFLADEDGIRQSLAGGQEKSILAVLDKNGHPQMRLPQEGDQLALPVNGAPSTLILKPDNPLLPGMPENEAYCLELARQLDIESARSAVLTAGNRKALAILRYDRTLTRHGSIERLHQEDFVQANGKRPAQKYERTVSRGMSTQDIFATARLLPPKDRLALIDQYIFNILVANTDAHAKNYSILISPHIRLAPLYDVSTVLDWPRINKYHAQNLAGKKRKPGDIAGRHWEQIATESGFNAREFKGRVDQLVEMMVRKRDAAIEAVCGNGQASLPAVRKFADSIEANALRILGRIKA